MTVSMLIDRLDRLRQGVLKYRELCKGDVQNSHGGSDSIQIYGLEDMRCKLLLQYECLQEYVEIFSLGRFQIRLDSGVLQDVYVQAFSENGRQWHLDTVLNDLASMIERLQEGPLHEPVMLLAQRSEDRSGQPGHSFGSLGHLGYSAVPATCSTPQESWETVAHVLQQRLERAQDRETLRAHLHAILDHPEVSSSLPSPSAQLI